MGQCSLPGFEELTEPLPTEQPGEPAPARPQPTRRPRAPAQGPVDPLLDPDLRDWMKRAEAEQPRVREQGQCPGVDGACPWVSCRYHLWAERPVEFEQLVEQGPEDWGDTCALDVADRTSPPKSRRLEIRRSKEPSSAKERGDALPIGRPGPVAVREGDELRWVWPPPPFDRPHESNRAVVGRFLGGLSRETVRLDEVKALEALRSDPAIAEAFPWLAEAELGDDGEGEDDDDPQQLP